MCDLYAIKSGKIVGSLVTELFCYSIINPTATTQEAQNYMMSRKNEFL
jgi:hypothetical protein